MNALARSLRFLNRAEKVLCCGAFAVMALVLMLDLVLRETAGNGLVWARQVSVYADIVVAMFGLGLASAAGAHLRPRFADRLIPSRWEPLTLRLSEFTTALILLLFALIALQLVAETVQLREVSTVLRTPIWPVQILIPAAFLLASLRHACYGCFPALRPAGS